MYKKLRKHIIHTLIAIFITQLQEAKVSPNKTCQPTKPYITHKDEKHSTTSKKEKTIIHTITTIIKQNVDILAYITKNKGLGAFILEYIQACQYGLPTSGYLENKIYQLLKKDIPTQKNITTGTLALVLLKALEISKKYGIVYFTTHQATYYQVKGRFYQICDRKKKEIQKKEFTKMALQASEVILGTTLVNALTRQTISKKFMPALLENNKTNSIIACTLLLTLGHYLRTIQDQKTIVETQRSLAHLAAYAKKGSLPVKTGGANNLGNTCFLNATNQAIKSVYDSLAVSVPYDKLRSSQKKLRKNFEHIIHAMQNKRVYNKDITDLIEALGQDNKNVVREGTALFNGRQQDAQEYLSYLLDALDYPPLICEVSTLGIEENEDDFPQSINQRLRAIQSPSYAYSFVISLAVKKLKKQPCTMQELLRNHQVKEKIVKSEKVKTFLETMPDDGVVEQLAQLKEMLAMQKENVGVRCTGACGCMQDGKIAGENFKKNNNYEKKLADLVRSVFALDDASKASDQQIKNLIRRLSLDRGHDLKIDYTCGKKLNITCDKDVVILHLKRFDYDAYGKQEKIDNPTKDPRLLEINSSRFELVATVQHRGTSCYSGHYVAYLKEEDDKKNMVWKCYDDSSVFSVSGTQLDHALNTSYLYFYKKQIQH